ncbi:hypothetical protein VF10_31720, partial [Nostoc linckia z13]
MLFWEKGKGERGKGKGKGKGGKGKYQTFTIFRTSLSSLMIGHWALAVVTGDWGVIILPCPISLIPLSP